MKHIFHTPFYELGTFSSRTQVIVLKLIKVYKDFVTNIALENKQSIQMLKCYNTFAKTQISLKYYIKM